MKLIDCEVKYSPSLDGTSWIDEEVNLTLAGATRKEADILTNYCKDDRDWRKLSDSLDKYRHYKQAKESLERYNDRYCKASRYVSYDRKEREKLIPKKVIFNPPATIVFWKDGTKTIVKCREDDIFDEEIGLAMAIAQKFAGDRSKFKKIVKKASRPQEKHTL